VSDYWRHLQNKLQNGNVNAAPRPRYLETRPCRSACHFRGPWPHANVWQHVVTSGVMGGPCCIWPPLAGVVGIACEKWWCCCCSCYSSETYRKNDCSYLFLLFPAAAAPAPATPVAGCDAKNRTTPSSKSPFSSCFLNSNHSQQQIPMAVKDGKASKLCPETA